MRTPPILAFASGLPAQHPIAALRRECCAADGTRAWFMNLNRFRLLVSAVRFAMAGAANAAWEPSSAMQCVLGRVLVVLRAVSLAGVDCGDGTASPRLRLSLAVLRMCDWFHVHRVHAATMNTGWSAFAIRISRVAEMIKVEIIRDGANQQFIHGSGSSDLLTAKVPTLRVASTVEWPCPEPASLDIEIDKQLQVVTSECHERPPRSHKIRGR